MLNVAISDWVVATTSEDELVHGYVEAIAWQHGIAFVHVIASDQDEIIGHQIEVKLSSVKALPLSGLDTEASIRSMIDLALSRQRRTVVLGAFRDFTHLAVQRIKDDQRHSDLRFLPEPTRRGSTVMVGK